MAARPLYRISFLQQGELWELYARDIFQSELWGFIEVEAGYQDDNVNDSSFFGMLRLSLALGRVPSVESRGLIDDVAFRYDDVSALTLDKVRRQNTIVVERVSSAPGSATVTVSRGS